MKKFNLEASNAPKLTAAQAAKLNNMTDGQIDYSDIPELDEAFFTKVAFLENWPPAKKQLTVKIDEDVLTWLRSMGKGYQTKINHILRIAMEHQKPRVEKH
jgi:uncharacterized protein (DUF4415 family)